MSKYSVLPNEVGALNWYVLHSQAVLIMIIWMNCCQHARNRPQMFSSSKTGCTPNKVNNLLLAIFNTGTSSPGSPVFLSSNQWLGSLIKSFSSIIEEPGRQKLLAHSSNRCSHWTTWNCKDSGIRRAFVPWVLKIYILRRKGCCNQVFAIFHIGLDFLRGMFCRCPDSLLFCLYGLTFLFARIQFSHKGKHFFWF